MPAACRRDPEYQEAHKSKETFSPKEDVDYDWVHEYALLIYDRFDQAEKALDAKAESIIKFLGGGSGLLTLGAIVNLRDLGLPVAMALGVSLLLALVAIGVAAGVGLPRQGFLPRSVARGLAYAVWCQLRRPVDHGPAHKEGRPYGNTHRIRLKPRPPVLARGG